MANVSRAEKSRRYSRHLRQPWLPIAGWLRLEAGFTSFFGQIVAVVLKNGLPMEVLEGNRDEIPPAPKFLFWLGNWGHPTWY